MPIGIQGTQKKEPSEYTDTFGGSFLLQDSVNLSNDRLQKFTYMFIIMMKIQRKLYPETKELS